jgi:hypothetical protein
MVINTVGTSPVLKAVPQVQPNPLTNLQCSHQPMPPPTLSGTCFVKAPNTKPEPLPCFVKSGPQTKNPAPHLPCLRPAVHPAAAAAPRPVGSCPHGSPASALTDRRGTPWNQPGPSATGQHPPPTCKKEWRVPVRADSNRSYTHTPLSRHTVSTGSITGGYQHMLCQHTHTPHPL